MAIFTDFNNSFAIHPPTGDLSLKNDADSVKQSIKNLVLTDKGERLFQPNIGCKIRSLLFENFTPQSKTVAKQTIEQTIEQYEPRAQLINIDISSSPDNNYMYVSVMFNLINSPTAQTLELELERVR
jgi:phage baseplate assembly protein W